MLLHKTEGARSYSDKVSHNYFRFLEASASSLAFSILGTFAILWYGGRIANGGYDFWFLNLFTDQVSLGELVEIEYSLFNASLLFQNATLNNVLLFVFWIFLGVLVYEAIQATIYFSFEIQQEKQLIVYEKPGEQHHVPSLIHTSLKKVGLRFIFALLLSFYLSTCLQIFWPALLSVFINKLFDFQSILDAGVILAVLALIGCTLHFLVVFLRLFSLHPRIFEKTE